ncbi:1-acyl-sn-glycerol-3-phosphate acyltransferase [Lampropedia puyangensis]|uniref:1-acyl-sn-glycerol-3-phosphate acyltransferase n=1 Tax=Lampropedia puyangensis TaxID=1330072 RepID=A0A4S8F7E9_9BURK|nr:lysophospholipid acyltransferase family protein [Lampropedia puyangensis]THU02575.1 1-acyl-sn-glycerol-3-phosphate acyltransferase [Lampropedia puyangensis]
MKRLFSLIDIGWRFLATVISFTVFGLGGLALRCIAFPLMHWWFRDQTKETILARKLINRSFRLFTWLMAALGIYRVEIQGAHHLNRPGLLLLANHPTLIDIVFLISLTERANCIVKSSLLTNPFTRGPLRGANYIINNREGAALLEACIASIQCGDHLIIFPEGTRTRHGSHELELHRGSANIAVRAGHPITPVLIHCDQPFLTKGAPWWKIPPQRPNLRIEIGEDLDTTTITQECANEALAARFLNQYMKNYFEKEIIHAASGRSH